MALLKIDADALFELGVVTVGDRTKILSAIKIIKNKLEAKQAHEYFERKWPQVGWLASWLHLMSLAGTRLCCCF